MQLKDSSIVIDITSCAIYVQQSMQRMEGWKDDMLVYLWKYSIIWWVPPLWKQSYS
jgi:hypothetical protein